MDAEGRQPARLTPLELFLLFLRISVQSFGGTLPFTRRELVERRRLLTGPEFAEMLAIGQILPGPNVINLSGALGDRHAGPRGAAAAVAGMVVVPVLIVMALATLVGTVTHLPAVQGALLGMAAAASGLLLGTAWRMGEPIRRAPRGLLVFVGVFAAVALMRLPLALVLLAAIPLSLALHGVFGRFRQ
jgi:chromate transporter